MHKGTRSKKVKYTCNSWFGFTRFDISNIGQQSQRQCIAKLPAI